MVAVMNGDLMTVLRHLAENVQWGGNRGQRDETFEALDRLNDESRRETPETPAETPETPTPTNDTPKTPGRRNGR
jgi:hypothetical protein